MAAVKQEPGTEPDEQQLQQQAEAGAGEELETHEEDLVLPGINVPRLSGYIPNRPIPPEEKLQEQVTASYTLHPMTRDTLGVLYEDWMKEANQDELRWNAIMNGGFEHQVNINPAFSGRFSGPDALCPASVLVAGVVRCFGMAGLPHPGETLPLSIGLIGAKPEIENQTKMMGLVASQDLPKGFVLGPLAGYYVPSDIAAHQIQTAPMNPGVKCTPERWKFECARYLFDTKFVINDTNDQSKQVLATFSIWGMGYGGQGMLMNDAVSNPVTWVKRGDGSKTYFDRGNNVEVVVVDVRGMPIPFLVLSQDVTAGQPLYRDYGLEWWKRHIELRKSAAEAEEEAEETQGPETVAALAAESGIEPLSVLGGKAVSSAFVPPEQQGAVVPFVDLSLRWLGPPQQPEPAPQADGAAPVVSGDDVSNKGGAGYLFQGMNDPNWRTVFKTWYSENARCWELAQQQAIR